MKNLFISMTMFGAALLSTASAQSYVHQVLFLNEGHYDYTNMVQTVPVTLGTYSPTTHTYSVVDTILNARFASDVIVDGQFIYVAADSFLVKYDINTYQKTASKVVPGIRKLALWNNQLLVSRGDVVNFKSYFQVYDKSTLGFIYELDTLTGPKYASQGIVVYNDSAYLAINNAFDYNGNYKGLLGIINLQGQNYANEINLGVNGVNPDNIMRKGNMIYTLNNGDFSSSSITTFNANNHSSNTVRMAISSGCGGSAFAANYVYYDQYSINKLARFDVNTQTVLDTLNSTMSYYGMLTDTINNLIYATATDYVTYGTAYRMQLNGTVIDSFAVGVSPGTMALDVRVAAGINEMANTLSVNVYPNPASSTVNIAVGSTASLLKLSLYDVIGNKMYEKPIQNKSQSLLLNIENYPSGIYFLTIESAEGKITQKLIKY